VKNGNEWHLVCDVFRTVRRNTVNYQYTVKQKELVLLTSGAPKPFTGKLYFPFDKSLPYGKPVDLAQWAGAQAAVVKVDGDKSRVTFEYSNAKK
jgi:hypothetical protein